MSGDVALRDATLVIETEADAGDGIGAAATQLGAALARLRPDTRVGRPNASAGDVVVVVRDGDAAQARALIARGRRVVVVETGRPAGCPDGAAGYLVTHGAGQASVEAAARVLAGG